MRDPPFFPHGTRPCDTGNSPEHRRNHARPAEANGSEKPCLFNKRIIFRGAEKCCRNVTAVRYDRRARRAERAGRSFIGIGVRMRLRRSETFHRTHERGTEGIFVILPPSLPYIETISPRSDPKSLIFVTLAIQIWKNAPGQSGPPDRAI